MTGQARPNLRIVVADDQASVREGLVVLLGLLPGIEVVGSAANGQEAIDLVCEHHPDAILLDLHMPVLDGIQATRVLTSEHPDVAIVVLTTYTDDTSVLAALRGRSPQLPDQRRRPGRHRPGAAQRRQRPRRPRPGRPGHRLVAAATRPTGPDLAPPTLPDVLPDGLTQAGSRNTVHDRPGAVQLRHRQIDLYLSAHTVKSHINHIFAKTGSPGPGRRRPLRPPAPPRLTNAAPGLRSREHRWGDACLSSPARATGSPCGRCPCCPAY